jgi:hypothetical protein
VVNDIPVDDETSLGTSGISRSVGAQSFECAHRGRVCVRVFIGVSVCACYERLRRNTRKPADPNFQMPVTHGNVGFAPNVLHVGPIKDIPSREPSYICGGSPSSTWAYKYSIYY